VSNAEFGRSNANGTPKIYVQDGDPPNYAVEQHDPRRKVSHLEDSTFSSEKRTKYCTDK
jgi:hypothetical protein